MGSFSGLLGAVAVAFAYIAAYPSAAAKIGSLDLFGVALCAGIAALALRGFVEYLAARQRGAPLTAALAAALGLRNIAFAVGTGWLVAAVAIYLAGQDVAPGSAIVWQYIAVAVLSGAVAYGELISRYRDAPGRLLAADPTAAYLCVNIAAGTAALALVKEFGAVTAGPHKLVYEALLAGFGAIAFFRSSLFNLRVSGTDIGVGPSTLLKTLLDTSDMMLNRWQALSRADQVRTIMQGVDFEKAKTALPMACFTLMSEFPPAVQTSVADQIKKLEGLGMAPDAQAVILGSYMIQQVGPEVLRRAVDTLGKTIRSP